MNSDDANVENLQKHYVKGNSSEFSRGSSLRGKLTLFFALIAIIPVAIVGYFEIQDSQSALEKHIGDSSLELARMTLANIQEYLYTVTSQVQKWASDEAVGLTWEAGRGLDHALVHMANLREANDEFALVALIKPDGSVLAAHPAEFANIDLRSNQAFKDALGGKTSLADVELNETVGDYVMTIACPIKASEEQDSVSTVLCVLLKWERIDRMITNIRINEKGQDYANHFMLTNRDGLTISCSNREELFKTNLDDVGMLSSQYAGQQKEGYLVETSEHGLKSFATYTYSKPYKNLSSLGWRLIYLQDADIVFSAIHSLKKTLAVILSITILAVLVAAFLLGRKVAKPILAVAEAAREIGHGNLEAAVHIESNDEVGLLADSFNKMCLDLQESGRALKENEERLSAVINANKDAMIAVDEEARIILFNPAAEKMLGWTSEEILGSSIELLVPEDMRSESSVISSFFGTEEERLSFGDTLERTALKKSGALFPIETSFSTGMWGGKPFTLGIVRDVSPRKEREEQIEKGYKLQDLLNSLSLTALEDLPLDEQLRKALETIINSPFLPLQTSAAVFLVGKPETLELEVHCNLPKAVPIHCAQVPFGRCVCGRAAQTGQIQFTDCVDEKHETTYENIKPHGHYCVPIKHEDEVLGVFLLYLNEGHAYNERESEFLMAVGNIMAGLIVRKRNEEALVQSEALYRSVVQDQTEFIDRFYPDGTIIFVNDALCRHAGKTKEELIGTDFCNYLPEESADFLRRKLKNVSLSNPVFVYEHKVRLEDGREKWHRWINRGIFDSDGNIKEFQAMGTDITEIHKSDEARTRLETAIEQASEAILITDTDHVILYVNAAYERITQYSRRELLGRTMMDVVENSKQDPEILREILETISQGATWHRRFVDRTKYGEPYNTEITVSPVRDSQGNIINYIWVQRDVTKEVELEQQLQRSQKLEAVGTLAGGMAQDFRNVLGAILGWTELAMDRSEKGSDVYDCLQHVDKAGRRVNELVSQMLTFSQQHEQDKKPVYLDTIVKESMKLLRGSIPPNIGIIQNIDAGCGPVLADPAQLNMVAVNLGANAFQAMSDGGILSVNLEKTHVTEEMAESDADLKAGQYVKLTVSDTGHGMTKEVLDHIFEPFFTTRAAGKGSGLGLSTVHGIVKAHDGAISVRSQPGAGTTFDVFFPLSTKTGRIGQELKEDPSAFAGTEVVLFVDDDEAFVKMGQTGLTDLGYRVEGHTDCIKAKEAFDMDPERFDIVLTDQIMPYMTGIELAKELRKKSSDTPILLVSAFSDTLEKTAAKEAGIGAIVPKPVTSKEMARAIRRALDGTKGKSK